MSSLAGLALVIVSVISDFAMHQVNFSFTNTDPRGDSVLQSTHLEQFCESVL